MRVLFLYIGHLHQVLHSLPIAADMAQRYPDVEVCVAAATEGHLRFIREMTDRNAPHAPLHYERLRVSWIDTVRRCFSSGMVLGKKTTLRRNRALLAGFDAIVVPERTSLFLGQLNLDRPSLIWTRHGAGDRAIGFADDIRQFDFVLMAGPKIEKRMLEAGVIRPAGYQTGVYAKFDWVKPSEQPIFDNDRPTVLYAPHFRPAHSSWPVMGEAVLEHFAKSEKYNLIFAPHVRLFHSPGARSYRPFARYRGLSNMHIDLGSVRSVDTTYTRMADVYLGDVSSLVAEFQSRPRPCVFLNAHKVAFHGDANYQFWTLGPVVETLEELDAALDEARINHARYEPLQRAYFQETFGFPPGSATAAVGSDAIVRYLRRRLEGAAETPGHDS